MDLETLAHRMEEGFASMHSELSVVKHTVEEVRIQATATNGRVTKLEMAKAYAEGVKAGAGGLWQYGIGLLGAAGIVLGIVTALTRGT